MSSDHGRNLTPTRLDPRRTLVTGAPPFVLRFVREFVHFFALILWIAAGLVFYAEANEPGQGMGAMGLAIVGVIIVNGLFSFFQDSPVWWFIFPFPLAMLAFEEARKAIARRSR